MFMKYIKGNLPKRSSKNIYRLNGMSNVKNGQNYISVVCISDICVWLLKCLHAQRETLSQQCIYHV